MIQLIINGRSSFSSLVLERKCPSGLDGTPPNLDVVLQSAEEVIAIESKLTEFLERKVAAFGASCDTISDWRRHTGWFKEFQALRQSPHNYSCLDAAQLIKHFFGLAHSFPETPCTLIYLYWEPLDWSDYEKFHCHRKEINEFAVRVQESRIRFRALSYLDLWKEWEGMADCEWLKLHVANLRKRYGVYLGSKSQD